MMKPFGLAFALAISLAVNATAVAQDYPTRQIVLIVPFPAGGSTDILARIIAEPMRQALGQPVIVQNVTGGGGPAMAALLANQVDFFCGEASQMLPHFQTGKIKPLIVMSKTRWRPLPEVPTMEDVGASDTYISFWNGLWAPKGTPKHVIAKVNDAAIKALADPNVIKRLTELGHDIPSREQLTPENLGTFHKAEIDKWWPLIKGAGIKVE